MLKGFINLFLKPYSRSQDYSKEHRQGILLQQFTWFGLLIQIPFIIIYLLNGIWLQTAIHLVMAVFFGLSLRLVMTGFQNAGRFFLINASNLGVLALALFSGKASGYHLIYFPIIFSASILVPVHRDIRYLYHILISVFAFIAIEFSDPGVDFDLINLSDGLLEIINLISFVTMVALISLSLFHLAKSNQIAESTIRSGERQNRALLEAIPDLMLTLRADGTLTQFRDNDHSTEGMPELSPEGNNIRDVYSREVSNTLLNAAREVLQGQAPQIVEIKLNEIDGAKEFEVRVVKASDEDALLIVRDITENKRNERALLESEANLKVLFDSSIQSFFLLDPEYRIMAFNKKASEGVRDIWSQDLNIGDPILKYSPLIGQEDFEADFSLALKGEQIRSQREIIIDENTRLFYQFDFIPAYDHQGRIFGISLSALDITEGKLAEEALKRKEEEASKLALVASRTDNSVITTDSKGYIEWVNNAFSIITEYSAEEAIGKKPGELLQGEGTDQATVLFMHECLMLGNGFQVEILNYTKSGKPFWIEIEVQPIYDEAGKVKQYFGIQNDITERKKYEEKLKKAKETAEAAARTKSEFLSNMSHEIRTPMNAIIGLTDLLLDSDLAGENRTKLNRIKYSANNLLNLINDILDFSKIEAGKLPIETINFNIRQLFEEYIQSVILKADEKHIEIRYSVEKNIPEYLVGDPLRLNQILLNLSSNAIKFTESGYVETRIELTSLEDDRLTLKFVVTDTGIGIEEEKLENIFDSFTQADANITRKYGGTGLGLSITKKLIELQGGRIWVESTLEQGSAFSFELPFTVGVQETVSKIEEEEEVKDDKDISGKKMLLVEDNLINQFVAEQILRSWNIEVDKADNGVQAIELLEKKEYDIILMDIQMPEMDGFQTTKIIRDVTSKVLNHHVPIIAVSADVFPETKDMAFEMGMNDFITKPIDQDELYMVLLKNCQAGMPSHLNHIEEKAEPMESSNSYALINLDFIKENISDDENFIRELLSLFKASNVGDIDELVEAGRSDDLERLREIAHKLKSSFRSLGLTETAGILETIERTARAGERSDKVPGLIEKVKEHFSQASKEIDAFS